MHDKNKACEAIGLQGIVESIIHPPEFGKTSAGASLIRNDHRHIHAMTLAAVGDEFSTEDDNSSNADPEDVRNIIIPESVAEKMEHVFDLVAAKLRDITKKRQPTAREVLAHWFTLFQIPTIAISNFGWLMNTFEQTITFKIIPWTGTTLVHISIS